jgi:hypothetical protein
MSLQPSQPRPLGENRRAKLGPGWNLSPANITGPSIQTPGTGQRQSNRAAEAVRERSTLPTTHVDRAEVYQPQQQNYGID